MSFCIEKTLMCLVLKIYLFPVLYLLITKLRTNPNVHQVLLYVISIQKWTGMKNNGLKMQRKIKFMFKSDFNTIRELNYR